MFEIHVNHLIRWIFSTSSSSSTPFSPCFAALSLRRPVVASPAPACGLRGAAAAGYWAALLLVHAAVHAARACCCCCSAMLLCYAAAAAPQAAAPLPAGVGEDLLKNKILI